MSPALPTTAQLAEIRERAGMLDDSQLIYQGPQQSIHHFSAAGLDLIAKSYQFKSLKDRLAALLRYSRARRSYRAGRRLVDAGIQTPYPFLLIEAGGLSPKNSLLITNFCPHPALLDLLNLGEPLHPTTLQNIFKLLHQLAGLRYGHGDFHARNLLVDPEGGVHLIDLDGMQYRHRNSQVTRHTLKDRDRLLRSLQPLPEIHARFVQVLGAPGEPLPDLSS